MNQQTRNSALLGLIPGFIISALLKYAEKNGWLRLNLLPLIWKEGMMEHWNVDKK